MNSTIDRFKKNFLSYVVSIRNDTFFTYQLLYQFLKGFLGLEIIYCILTWQKHNNQYTVIKID